MADETMARVELIQLQVQRVQERAERAAAANDLAAITACREEMEVLLESIRQIREEQLMAQLERPKRRKRWWRMAARPSVEGEERDA